MSSSPMRKKVIQAFWNKENTVVLCVLIIFYFAGPTLLNPLIFSILFWPVAAIGTFLLYRFTIKYRKEARKNEH